MYTSYRSKKRARGPRKALVALVKILLLTAAVYALISGVLLRSYRVGSVSMAPGFEVGQRIFVSPLVFGPRLPWGEARLPGIRSPSRGDVVVLESPYSTGGGWLRRTADPVVRLFSLGRRDAFRVPVDPRMTRLMLKRIIGIPGDTVRLEAYRAWIRPGGATEFVAEAELIEEPYAAITGRRYDVDGFIPFGGDMPPLDLGAGEYFVLGDNRPDSSDSRSWGVVRLSRMVGAAIFRYHPVRDFGRI